MIETIIILVLVIASIYKYRKTEDKTLFFNYVKDGFVLYSHKINYNSEEQLEFDLKQLILILYKDTHINNLIDCVTVTNKKEEFCVINIRR